MLDTFVSDGDEGEDKMLKSAREEHKSPIEIAEHYTKLFFKDLERLNIETPEIVCKATEHIKEMLEMVEKIMEKWICIWNINSNIFWCIKIRWIWNIIRNLN